MKHTHDCIEMEHAVDFARTAWEERWSLSCRKCEGHGGLPIEDTIAWPGGKEVILKGQTPCPYCIQIGVCSRCSYNVGDWIYPDPCPICGWSWDLRPGDSIPDEHTCNGECMEGDG